MDTQKMIKHLGQIARAIAINHEILRAMEGMSRMVYAMQRDAVEAFLKKDVMLAIATMGKMTDIRRKEKRLLTTILKRVKDADVAVTLSHIARDLRRIAGYSVAIADDAMNRTLVPEP